MTSARIQKSAAWVYIAECADGSYYTGATKDPTSREAAHNKGTGAKYTRTRRPIRMVFKHRFDSLAKAMSAESRIKRWPRARKEALVARQIKIAVLFPDLKRASSRSAPVTSENKKNRPTRKRSTGR